MVLGILAAVGVTFIAGYVAHAWKTMSANQVSELEDDQRRKQIDQLQRQLKELENARSGSGCCYFFTLFLLFGFLIALGIILYATNFFRSQNALSTLLLD